MAKDERIRFPSGSYQALHKGICYRIDPENNTVEMTQQLKLKYSPESKEEVINLVNKLGAEKIQKDSDYSQNSLLFQYYYSYFLHFSQLISLENPIIL